METEDAFRVAIVTGSSRGIGEAVARRLASRGTRVVVNGRDPEAAEAVAASIRDGGGHALAVPGSVADDSAVEDLVHQAIVAFGRLDLLVNNVAVSPYYGPLLGVGRDALAKTLLGNTWPALRLVQAALETCFAASRGAVVNISTIGAQQTQPLAGPYTAAKAALEVLTRVMARELAPRRIRVNAVAPGVVQTRTSAVLWQDDDGRGEESLVPLGRLGTPEDIAAATAFLLSDDASWITGTTLVVDGGRLLVGDEPHSLFGPLAHDPSTAAGAHVTASAGRA